MVAGRSNLVLSVRPSSFDERYEIKTPLQQQKNVLHTIRP